MALYFRLRSLALGKWDYELLRPVGQHYDNVVFSFEESRPIPDRVCPIEPYDRWSLKLPSLFASDEDVQ